MPKYSAIPAHTPAIIVFLERTSFFFVSILQFSFLKKLPVTKIKHFSSGSVDFSGKDKEIYL
jgi:hypothetical protein